MKYKGPKIVAMDRWEMRQAIKNLSEWSKTARAVIVIAQGLDGVVHIQSTCADRWQTLLQLEAAKKEYTR